MATMTCPECGRVFDPLNEKDADEIVHGHDCEAEREPGYDGPEGDFLADYWFNAGGPDEPGSWEPEDDVPGF
jgi:hypothetical protein